MKKVTSIILLAIALVMSLTQCKKNNEENSIINEEGKTFITLDLNHGDGSKLGVDPPHVNFDNGDRIYVASNGVYVGYLEYNGTNFSGEISNATAGLPLYFYLLGNVTPAETLTSGSTTSCSVVISDQTVNKPVIACNKSNENFGTTNTFTSTLRNKCALVKFNVTASSAVATCITGFNNKVTVDFSNNTLTNSQESKGIITLPAGNGEKWAILLPQDAMGAGTEGSAYSVNGVYIGTCGAVPTITDNAYLTVGIEVTVTNKVSLSEVPSGAIGGLFSVSDNQQVYFSQGNLQYKASTNIWRFAENQWDYVGTQTPDANGNVGGTVNGGDNSNISQSYSGWIDLFGWGTSSYDHGAVCYQPWSTSTSDSDYYAYGNINFNLYDQTGHADWGYNPISNGGNTTNQWRTLSTQEWQYVFDTRSTTSGIRFALATVNNVKGVILLPDDWNTNIYSLSNTNTYGNSSIYYGSNILTALQWSTLEQVGAVFLPLAGNRIGISVNGVGDGGGYWTASFYNSVRAYYLYFGSVIGTYYSSDRYYGLSVRLVRDME